MRNALFGCASIGFAAALVAAVFVGCAATGTDGIGDGIAANDSTEPPANEAKLPPSTTIPVVDAGTEASKADAAPPAPTSGQPCTKVDEIFKRSCGACGTQAAICFAEEGGAATVSDYGPCTGEVVNGCIAGTVDDSTCDNCGVQKRTCDGACKWSSGACVQPPGACKPGTSEQTTAGCPTVNTYRQRSCQTTCSYTPYTPCVAHANPLVIEISAIKGQTATATVVLDTSSMGSVLPLPGTCPAANLVAGDYPYAYVELKNTTARAATVAVFTSEVAGSPFISRVLTGYSAPVIPLDAAARLQCAFGPTTGYMNNVGISPGKSMLVYLRSWYPYNAASPAQSTGVMTLHVRTDNLL